MIDGREPQHSRPIRDLGSIRKNNDSARLGAALSLSSDAKSQ